MNIGDKVYAYRDGKNIVSVMSDEPVIGNVVSVDGPSITIKSILDDDEYVIDESCVFEVGTGPGSKQEDELMLPYFEEAVKPYKHHLAYCDYIAALISEELRGDANSIDGIIKSCDGPLMDLHPDGGYMVSLKKTINVEDIYGRKYKVTIDVVE